MIMYVTEVVFLWCKGVKSLEYSSALFRLCIYECYVMIVWYRLFLHYICYICIYICIFGTGFTVFHLKKNTTMIYYSSASHHQTIYHIEKHHMERRTRKSIQRSRNHPPLPPQLRQIWCLCHVFFVMNAHTGWILLSFWDPLYGVTFCSHYRDARLA